METYLIIHNTLIASGSSKSAYVINDNHILLCPRLYKNHHDFDRKILKEYDMLCYLQSFSLPIIEETKIVKADGSFGISLALLQRYIKNTTLYKPFGISPMKLSDANLATLATTINILQTNQLYICDLQLLVSENELYIIDPSNIYNIQTQFYIGHHPRTKTYNDFLVAYANQIKVLQKIITFNSKEEEEDVST